MSKLSTTARAAISDTQFAFPVQRKEPIENASHVRNAIARFGQVRGVSDAERDDAWQRIRTAAACYGVQVNVADWRELRAGAEKTSG
jgi:hypothetical protein